MSPQKRFLAPSLRYLFLSLLRLPPHYLPYRPTEMFGPHQLKVVIRSIHNTSALSLSSPMDYSQQTR